MMVVLFDEKKVREIHEYNVRKDALEEGREEGRAEGMKRGRAEGIAAMVAAMAELSLGKDAIAKKLVQHFHLSPQAAAAKVEQYWDRRI